MDENFNILIDGTFNILRDKFYNELSIIIKNFQENNLWGDVELKLEINFQDGQIKRITSGCGSKNHVRANKNESSN